MYDYQIEKSKLFTDEGFKQITEAKDTASKLIEKAGAVRMDKIMSTGDTWRSMAVVEYLVECGYLIEVTTAPTMSQYRIFTIAP